MIAGWILVPFVTALAAGQADAQGQLPDSAGHPTAAAARRQGSIHIDGRLDEPDWERAVPAAGFRQQDPDPGKPATQRTEVRFLYDQDALYIGARMYDTAGANGVHTQLARRDEEPNADYIMFVFDTYHDHTGRVVFRVNPSGVKYDALSTSRANPDPSWNAVWDVATRMDSLGWTAEFRIPFSELRLASSGEQTWGLQIWRYVQRLNETTMWSFWSKRESGGPSAFGQLQGLAPALDPVAVEALPYMALGTAPRTPADYARGNEGTRRTLAAGADLRLRHPGLSATLTLNPDFGQVEVDPAVLNLTASETFFPEKRPFFVQDAGVLAFGGVDCYVCSNATPLTLYYSRRIGRPPSLHPTQAVTDVASTTRILGAARLTAQSRSGWSLGVLGAETDRELATVVDSLHQATSLPVEPATTYLVARAERRAVSGDATVGVIATAVQRRLQSDAADPLTNLLAARTATAGADADAWFGHHVYRLSWTAALSTLEADSSALLRIETNNVHDLQRLGRHAPTGGVFASTLAPTRGRLNGYAGTMRFAKEAGSWMWEGVGEVLSPGFEANDVGFVPVVDRMWTLVNVQRHFTTPHAWYQEAWLTLGTEGVHNFDHEAVAREHHAVVAMTLPAAWTAMIQYRHLPARLDDRLLRGGPTVGVGVGDALQLQVGTDPRRGISMQDTTWWSATRAGSGSLGTSPVVTLRPSGALALDIGLHVERATVAAQFVGAPLVYDRTAAGSGGAQMHWVVAALQQRTASVEMRVAAAFTPTLSLDAYVQPFVTTGAYTQFGEFPRAHALHPLVYGRDEGTITREQSADGGALLQIDADGSGPLQPFALTDPTGTTASLRGTAVLRWEYRPGSSAYLAWTQTRLTTAPWGTMDVAHDGSVLLDAPARNALVLKVTYRVAH